MAQAKLEGMSLYGVVDHVKAQAQKYSVDIYSGFVIIFGVGYWVKFWKLFKKFFYLLYTLNTVQTAISPWNTSSLKAQVQICI